MPRSQRFLTAAAAAAPPPEAVTPESDFVVILAALLCAVICVVGLLAVARCAWLRRSPGGGGGGGTSAQAASANKGLKKKVLQQLPKFTYDGGAGAVAPKMGSECAICLGEFAEGDEIRALPQCGHVFHVGCIDTWLGSHSSCPSCRQILVVAARCHKCGNFPAIPHAASTADLKDHVYHSAPPPTTADTSASPAAAAASTTTACSSSNSSNSNSTVIFLP